MADLSESGNFFAGIMKDGSISIKLLHNQDNQENEEFKIENNDKNFQRLEFVKDQYLLALADDCVSIFEISLI